MIHRNYFIILRLYTKYISQSLMYKYRLKLANQGNLYRDELGRKFTIIYYVQRVAHNSNNNVHD